MGWILPQGSSQNKSNSFPRTAPQGFADRSSREISGPGRLSPDISNRPHSPEPSSFQLHWMEWPFIAKILNIMWHLKLSTMLIIFETPSLCYLPNSGAKDGSLALFFFFGLTTWIQTLMPRDHISPSIEWALYNFARWHIHRFVWASNVNGHLWVGNSIKRNVRFHFTSIGLI